MPPSSTALHLPRKPWLHAVCLGLCIAWSTTHAQRADTTRATLKPTFALGTGMFAFRGDIGSLGPTYSPLVSRVGFDLRASTPVTPWLEAGLFALHGRVGVNEYSTQRNLNFESRITMGGFQLVYNFHQLLRPDRTVEPYVSIGFGTLEFLSKTDLFDAQGRPYHYWSDGSIRDLPESSPNAAEAQLVQRDYSYETDIRELNADGFGKYTERTFTMPIGIGAKMNIGGGFDLRVGTTLHLTQSDLIDGITDRSEGLRRGDGRNDRIIYSSISLGYAINMERERSKRSKPTITPEEMDMFVLNEDEDGDGVPDMRDECPHTPPGVAVDARGCPLDSDGDGVPDFRDDEPDTPPGLPVDARGVRLSDEDILRAYLNYKDSANVTVITSRAESVGPSRLISVNRPQKRTYVVQVGSQVEGISEEMIQRILSIPDVRAVERGDTTFYVVGDYASIPAALRRELALREQGIEGRVMAEEGGRLIDVDTEGRVAGTGAPGEASASDRGKVTVRVQLGAFRRPLASNIFKEVTDLVTIKGDDGLTRYYTGAFTDINQAAAHKVNMLLQGFDGAFLVAFRDGKRVSIQQAGALLTKPEQMQTVPSGSINKDLIRFRVQLGTFAGNVPTDLIDMFIDIGDVKAVTSADAVRYFHGNFTSRADAERAQAAVRAKGIPDAFVVGDVDGRIIPADDAERLLRD